MVRTVDAGERAGNLQPLRGKQVAITGRLASMTRDEAGEWIRRLGGELARVPSQRTSLVVVGEETWPPRVRDRVPESLEKAKKLQEAGCELTVISERSFLEMLSLGEAGAGSDFQRLYTTAQLSRILRVPGRRIRSWIRRGLITPVRTVHRLDCFDFRQMTELKMLRELTEGGVTIEEIRKSLELVSRWLPEAERSLARLATLEGDQLRVRVEGRLAEPSGQLRLDFDEADRDDAADREPGVAATVEEAIAGDELDYEPPDDEASESSPAERFEIAVELEEEGALEEAASAYEEAFAAGGESAEIAFNLGNVLFALGKKPDAIEWFEIALELDPKYVEAWNNLASAHAELEEWPKAIAAGCRAVDLHFDYPDAHYNLAQAYHGAGQRQQALRHARIYLKFDPRSEWAVELREKLGIA
ncbi:MAG: tetratricopeptide repeat protein [bacterium]